MDSCVCHFSVVCAVETLAFCGTLPLWLVLVSGVVYADIPYFPGECQICEVV